MPYTQRLTWDGVALHAGGLPGYPESHGCVHLPLAFAQELFKITSIGVTVVVEGSAVSHVNTIDASLLAPVNSNGAAAVQQRLDTQPFRWTPEQSPTGPLTIIVSKHDQAIVVLRNGVEIGRTVAQIDDDDPGSHVINLTLGPDGKLRWIYVGLPGHDDDNGHELDDARLQRVRMPRQFYESLKAILAPGTTILVTQSSVGEEGTGRRLTVIDSVAPRK